ncbi:MAG: DNA-directed RNA polymerase subunit A'' [archaeon]
MDNDSWIQAELPESMMADLEKAAKQKKVPKEKLMEEAKALYAAAQIAPGEAIGIVTAQSIGEPGTQMSVAYDEKIIVKQDGEIKIVKIGELIDAEMQENRCVTENGHEILDLQKELYVPSLTDEEQIEWKQVSALSRHRSPEKLIRIKTRSGREITATPFHSFVIRQDNKIVPIEGSKLKPGDRIPALRELRLAMQDASININMQPILEAEIPFLTAGNGLLYAYPRAGSKPLPQNIELDEEFGWLVGIYLSEGNATRSYFSISNTNEVVLEKIRGFAQKYELTFNEYDNFRGFAKGHDIRVNSTLLAQLLKATCKSGSAQKRTPEFAYSASDSFIAGLLRGYFDGDGNVNLQRKVIRACSKSKELIDGISLLLSRLGIFSTKSFDGKSHWLTISYRYAKTFLEMIGSDIDYKRTELKAMSEIKSEEGYNLVDIIPGVGTVLFDCAKKLGMPTRLVNNFTKRQKIGRSTLQKYIPLFESLAATKDVSIQQELSIMRRASESDVIWDEIESTEYVKSPHLNVYDFTVPGSETFTTFDGIITHNTMRTHHMAGVSELNVTLGLPRIIEILDARKDPKTPSMFVYLKSQFSKSREEAEKLAARIKQVTVKELAKEVSLNLATQCIEVMFDRDELKKHNTTVEKIAVEIEKPLKGSKIDRTEVKITIKPKLEEVKKIYRLKEKVKEIAVAGVKDVTNVLPVWKKDTEEYVIQTFGSNLKDVFVLPEVDEARTTTNDLHEIADVLGIEAARAAVIIEITTVLEEQGMPVDIRYVELVSDLMCLTGELQGITRHGITSQKSSVLARASFEIPLKHLIDASVIGETDQLTSVVENVMINQPIPVGTGLPDLVVKMETVAKHGLARPSGTSSARESEAPEKTKKETARKKTAPKKAEE